MVEVDRTPKPCHHPRANHQHGTYVTYKRDICRCIPCTRAAARYEKQSSHKRATGRSSYVAPTRAREHLEQLLATLTLGQIEARSGVHRTALRVLSGDYPSRPASRRITRTTETRILAVPAGQLDQRDRDCLVDPTGTRRRLQALMAIGWPGSHLVRRLGWSSRTLWMLIHASPAVIRSRTREQVTALYEELWDTSPAPSRQVTMVRRLAQRRGWAVPMAWDDDTLDDPNADPAPLGLSAPLTARIEDLVHIDPTVTMAAATDRLHARRNTIERALYRAGRTDLIRHLNRTNPDAPIHRSA